jgi:hypothetical protein
MLQRNTMSRFDPGPDYSVAKARLLIMVAE